MTQQIEQLMDALSARFGATGVHIWEVFVRQQIIEATMSIVWVVFFALAVLIWWKMLVKRIDWDEEAQGVPTVIIGIVVIVLFIINLLVAMFSMPAFWNPEFYALQELLP